MTITKIYLIDSRLNRKRSVQVQVKFFQIVDNKVKYQPQFVEFSALGSDYRSARSLDIDLPDGDWQITFPSSAGNLIAYEIRIPVNLNTCQIDVAMLDGYISPIVPRHFNYEPRRKSHDLNDRAPRRFTASSTNSIKLDNPRHATSNNTLSKLQVTCETFELSDDYYEEHEKKQFEARTSFDEKLAYWFEGWRSVDRKENIKFDLDVLSWKGICTAKLRIESKFSLPRKMILYFNFFDERYLLSIPCKCTDLKNAEFNLDIEIDFYDTPELSSNERIVQIRVFTGDSVFNGVAQQLSKGNLYSAKQLSVVYAEDLLREKFSDPAAAAAGALVLVQPEITGNVEYLRNNPHIADWIGNLQHKFKWIPEGAICSAWMLGSRNEWEQLDDVNDGEELRKQVATLMKEAVRRGLPIYLESLNLLSKGIEWTGMETPIDMRLAVRWLTLNSVNAGPFVLIRDRSKE